MTSKCVCVRVRLCGELGLGRVARVGCTPRASRWPPPLWTWVWGWGGGWVCGDQRVCRVVGGRCGPGWWWWWWGRPPQYRRVAGVAGAARVPPPSPRPPPQPLHAPCSPPPPPPPPPPQAIRKQVSRGLKKEQKEEMESGEKILAWLEEGKDVRFGEWGLRWGLLLLLLGAEVPAGAEHPWNATTRRPRRPAAPRPPQPAAPACLPHPPAFPARPPAFPGTWTCSTSCSCCPPSLPPTWST
jgi:hypothetical protein